MELQINRVRINRARPVSSVGRRRQILVWKFVGIDIRSYMLIESLLFWKTPQLMFPNRFSICLLYSQCKRDGIFGGYSGCLRTPIHRGGIFWVRSKVTKGRKLGLSPKSSKSQVLHEKFQFWRKVKFCSPTQKPPILWDFDNIFPSWGQALHHR